jgi:anthranilate phosphoribosyltransferase
MANLTPLLCMLLVRRGVPVLMHGVTHDPQRVTSAEIFSALGVAHAGSAAQAEALMAAGQPAFIPIAALAPPSPACWACGDPGVRNSTHTLVKIMQPFAQPALRLTSYTHPEYLEMLTDYFSHAAPHDRGDAFLMRGTEGRPWPMRGAPSASTGSAAARAPCWSKSKAWPKTCPTCPRATMHWPPRPGSTRC